MRTKVSDGERVLDLKMCDVSPPVRTFPPTGLFFLLLVFFSVVPTFLQAAQQVAQLVSDLDGTELPFFSPDPAAEAEEDPFRLAMDAYQAGDFLLAIQETQRLKETLSAGTSSETAVFLLGDLYLKWGLDTQGAGEVRGERLNDALSAFQEAVVRYPDSENAVRGLWRMGQVYRGLALYPESVASFRRVLTRYPKSPFSVKSRLGIAQTYLAWGKLKSATAAFKKVGMLRLSPADRKALGFSEADMAYQTGDSKVAYQKYSKMGFTPENYVRMDRGALFQYGESAYQSGHPGKAREVFQAFHNIYPKDPFAAIALARVGETWRTDSKTKGAVESYEAIRGEMLLMDVGTIEEKAGRLLSAVGSLSQRRECVLALPQILPSGCVPVPQVQGQKKTEASLPPLAVREVIGLSYDLMQEEVLPTVFQDILYSSAKALRGHGYLDAPLAIEHRLLLSGRKMEETPFQKRVRVTFQETMEEAVAERVAKRDALTVSDFYYLYPTAFSEKMLSGMTGMRVAESLAEIGLLSEAAAIYGPISESAVNPRAEEALARLGKLNFKKRAYVDSRQNMVQFLSGYPLGAQSGEMKRVFGDLSAEEGDMASAIEQYRDWLARHPGHADREAVMSSLASAYVKVGDMDAASAVYGSLLENEGHQTPETYVRGADVYYRLGRYKDAITYYELALKVDPRFKYAGWINLQIANSYRAIGQVEKGQAIFVQLAQQSDDPIIRHLAAEKAKALR
jgi:tetratricopeptide (TPR) repeat protein